MIRFIVTTLLVGSCVLASPLLTEDIKLLSREERAAGQGNWRENKPAEVALKCYAGDFASIKNINNHWSLECQQCPEGSYTKNPGLWTECVLCPDKKSTPPSNSSECFPKCKVGKEFMEDTKECKPCEPGTFQDEEGLRKCKPCGPFKTSKKGAKSRESCWLDCPAGFEPVTVGEEDTCMPCKFGFYNKGNKGKGNKECLSCCGKSYTNGKDNCKKTTLKTGAESQKDCVRLPKTARDLECFDYLTRALEAAAGYIGPDDGVRSLRRVLCRSENMDMQILKAHYITCREVYLEDLTPLLPKIRINQETFVGLEEILTSDVTTLCKDLSSEDENPENRCSVDSNTATGDAAAAPDGSTDDTGTASGTTGIDSGAVDDAADIADDSGRPRPGGSAVGADHGTDRPGGFAAGAGDGTDRPDESAAGSGDETNRPEGSAAGATGDEGSTTSDSDSQMDDAD